MLIQISRAGVKKIEYLNVGSNGFAQLGDSDYFAKSKVEISHLFELLENKFPVPLELTNHFFSIKAFSHDFGTYHKITEAIKTRYLTSLNTEKGEHLSIMQKEKYHDSIS